MKTLNYFSAANKNKQTNLLCGLQHTLYSIYSTAQFIISYCVLPNIYLT